MPQVFAARSNVIAKAAVFAAVLALAGLLCAGLLFMRSSYGTGSGLSRVQAVPFSHNPVSPQRYSIP